MKMILDIEPGAPGLRALDADRVLAAIGHMSDAPTVEQVWHLFVRAMSGFGFVGVNYGYTRYQNAFGIGDPEDALFLSTHSLERVKEFHTSGLYLKTPEYRWTRENVGACSWGYLKLLRDQGRMTEVEMAAQDKIGARRERAGYTISFAEGSPRSKGAMGLAADRGVTQAEVDAHWDRYSASVMALANLAHFKISQMPLPVPRLALSDRQREILDWIADGKTVQDVAVVTGLSVSAVEKHLRRIREALGVETSAHAVAKAAFFNQIFVMAQGRPSR